MFITVQKYVNFVSKQKFL